MTLKQVIILALTLTTLLSCSNTIEKKDSASNEEKIEQSKSDFEIYLSSLDQIPLPLKTNPLGQLPKISKKYDINGFQKFKHIWTSQPLGIYYRDHKIIGIIDCSIGDCGLVPFLTTYDFKGNKIDSASFYKKSGQGIGYEAIEYLKFEKNKTIIVLDTVKQWDLNEDETDIVERSMKMTTGKVVYRILDNGQIERK